MPLAQRLLAAFCAVALSSTPAFTQQPTAAPASAATPPADTASVTTPLLPLPGVHYRYWPLQIVQWIGPELPYSMIVLDVDTRGKTAVYDAQLMPRAGGPPVHYTNSPEQAAIDAHAGMTVHQVAMQLDGPSEPAQGAQYLLRFYAEGNVPVEWQFVEGTDMSEQGSGMTPVDAPIPVLLYREQGALAGEGTAIKIGGVTSAAEVWAQYARPPYFVPYHGAISTGIHILSFTPGESAWKSTADSLLGPMDMSLALKRGAGELTMTYAPLGVSMVYTGDATAGISRVAFGPVDAKREDTISIVFKTPFHAGDTSMFEIVAGKKTKIAAGSVTVTKDDHSGMSARWELQSPDALKGKKATATSDPAL